MSGPLPEHVVQAFLDRCREERLAAGLPPHVEDVEVLRRLARMVTRGTTDPGDPLT